MSNNDIITSVKSAGVYLAGLLTIVLVAAGGDAEASRYNAGGSGRGAQGYEGHRGRSSSSRGGEYRGQGNRSGVYRGGRERAPVYPGKVVRHGGGHPGYWNGRGVGHYPRKGYHAPRHRHYPGPVYRRHICGPGARCRHSHRPYYWGYRPGYVAVRPAVGTLFLTLPLGCAGISIGGSLYYYFNDVYYRPVPTGYVVVAPPAATVPQIVSGEVEYTRVSVTVGLLNVRSGPGSGHAIFRQVRRGEVLDVAGESGGWLYVGLSDGAKGWIDAQYTAPMLYVDG